MSTAGFFMFRDNLTLGTFVVAALYKDQLKNSVGLAFDTWKRHQLLLPQRQLLAELPLPSSSASQSREITDGGIDFRDVSFRYFAFEPEVLKNFSIQIEPGEVVAFAGPSGVGKTTVARLIIGTLSPSSGSVLVDQLPAQAGTPGVGCLLQTDRLISGTVRDNVLMFRRGISDLDIWAALRTVCLDGLVEQLPMGLMTPVAEGLGGLSAGQRQRILLARTIVTKPRVLVLDEATSHLDASLEARIMEQLRCTNATIVLISHRSDLWRMADRVVEMSGSEAPILWRNMKDSGRTAETVEAA